MLGALARPGDLDELQRRLHRLGWEGDDPAYLSEMLRDLKARGLVTPLAEVHRRLAAGGRRQEVAVTESVPLSISWITRGRPAALARSVQTYFAARAGAPSTPGGTPPPRAALVFTDSEAGDDYRAALTRCDLPAGVDVRVVGREERRRFVDTLAEALAGRVERSLLDWAVLGPPEAPNRPHASGAMQNWHMLESPRRIAVCSDDDVFFPAVRRLDPATDSGEQAGRERAALSARHDPTSVRFYPTEAAAEGAVSPLEVDAGTHRAALAGLWNGEIDLAELSPETAAMADSLRPAVTCSGLAGDSGMGFPYARLFLEGDDREAFVAPGGAGGGARGDTTRNRRRDFDALLHSRVVVRHAPRTVYSAGLHFMTPHVAFDTRLDLAPFLPIGRGSDGLFRFVLGAACPDLLSVHLPFAVRHAPPDARSVGFDEYRSIRPRMCDLTIAALVAVHAQSGRDGAAAACGHRDVGRALAAFVSDTGDRFRSRVIEAWRAGMKAHVDRCAMLLKRYRRKPRRWARVMEQHRSAVEAHRADDEWSPADAPGESDAARWDSFHRTLTAYAELIAEWPAIVAAARAVAERGGPAGPGRAGELNGGES